jgi:hypothetical protein
MGLIGIIVLVAIISIVTIFLIRNFYVPSATITDLLKNEIPLSKATIVMNSDDVQKTLYGSDGSTIMLFVNARIGDKTPKYNGIHYPIASVDGAFSLEIAPTSIESKLTPARLRVITVNQGAEEIIDLPNFPLQKWVCVTILREGRRFDVMYDDTLVASKTLNNYPVIVAKELRVGSNFLLGKAIHCLVSDKRLHPTKVSQERANLVDTNGVPIVGGFLSIFKPVQETDFAELQIPSLSVLSCPPGSICAGINTPPSNSMQRWFSNYN